VGLVLAGPALLLLAFGVGNRWLALVACLLLAALGLAALTAPSVSGLVVVVRRPARAAVGDVVEHVVVVHNGGTRTSPALVLHLADNPFSPGHFGVPAVAPGEAVELRIRRTAVVRGAADGVDVVLEWADALGLVVQRRQSLAPAPVHVHPAPGAVPALPVPGPRAGAEDLAGVRPFRRGDSPAAVHWRASARRGGGPTGPALVVVERETPPVGIRVVALPEPAEVTAAEFEAVLQQATALLLADLSAGRRSGLLDADGTVHEGLRVLDALAVAQPAPRRLEAAQAAAGRDGEVVVAGAHGWRTR
jgi:uncharacterized protein (DUF58 family)